MRAFNAEITSLQGQLSEHLDQHPDAEIYLSQPGLGVRLTTKPPPGPITSEINKRLDRGRKLNLVLE
jgi:hypothetical protein